MNGSRRAFLAAVGATVVTGAGGQPAAARAGSGPAGEVTVSGSTQALADVAAAFERGHPDVSVSSVDGGVERFLEGGADVLHATRPMTAGERERADENGIEFAVAGLPLGGVAALGRSEGWCRCLRGGRDAFEGRSAVETWSELPGEVPDVLEPADPPEEGSNVLVRGTRPHQYAVGHGGVALYEAAPAAFAPFEADSRDRLTPVVRLEFAYVDRAALAREPVAALARFQEAATSGVEHFPIPDLASD